MANPDALFDLGGKVVVLVGGAGILGSRMCYALAANGAQVAIADFDPAKAEALAKELDAKFPGRVAGFEVDTRKKASLQALQAAVRERFGEPDVLVNNVNAKGPDYFLPFEDYPLEEWEFGMGLLATGAMLACQVFGSAMAARGQGSIINTLSIYGIVAPDQRIYEGSSYEGRAINTPIVYSAGKAAVWGMTKYLACYWAEKGVRVNAITPGGVFSGQNDTFVGRYSARIPMGRMAQGDEMSGALVYLASDASSYTTGHNMVVDGGLTAW